MDKDKNLAKVKNVEVESSPQNLIEMAIKSGANLDQLEKLLILKERYEQNEARKAYFHAITRFKENPPKIEKDREIKYSTPKGNVGYKHATLSNIVDKVTVELSKYGLSISWEVKQDKNITVTCKVTHELGHSESTSISAESDTSGAKNSIQAIASTISYLQRYSCLSILGLAPSDVDTDGVTPDEKISQEELSKIKEGLEEIKADEERFKKYMGVEKLEDIGKKDYTKALAAIDAKKEKKN